MSIREVKLFLFPEPDYNYDVVLEGASYNIRLYYQERSGKWMMDLRYSSGEPLVLGYLVTVDYPMMFDYELPLKGFFIANPKGSVDMWAERDWVWLPKNFELFYVYERDDQ